MIGVNIGKPKRKWKIYQLKEDEHKRFEELIGWLLECEDYVLFYPIEATRQSFLCSSDEIETGNLRDSTKVVLDRVKMEYKENLKDVFSMAQPEVVF